MRCDASYGLDRFMILKAADTASLDIEPFYDTIQYSSSLSDRPKSSSASDNGGRLYARAVRSRRQASGK